MGERLDAVYGKVHQHFAEKNFFEGTHGNRMLLFVDYDTAEPIHYKEGDHLEVPQEGEEVILSTLNLSGKSTPEYQQKTGVFQVERRSHRLVSVKGKKESKDISIVNIAVRRKDDPAEWTKSFQMNGVDDDV